MSVVVRHSGGPSATEASSSTSGDEAPRILLPGERANIVANIGTHDPYEQAWSESEDPSAQEEPGTEATSYPDEGYGDGGYAAGDIDGDGFADTQENGSNSRSWLNGGRTEALPTNEPPPLQTLGQGQDADTETAGATQEAASSDAAVTRGTKPPADVSSTPSAPSTGYGAEGNAGSVLETGAPAAAIPTPDSTVGASHGNVTPGPLGSPAPTGPRVAAAGAVADDVPFGQSEFFPASPVLSATVVAGVTHATTRPAADTAAAMGDSAARNILGKLPSASARVVLGDRNPLAPRGGWPTAITEQGESIAGMPLPVGSNPPASGEASPLLVEPQATGETHQMGGAEGMRSSGNQPVSSSSHGNAAMPNSSAPTAAGADAMMMPGQPQTLVLDRLASPLPGVHDVFSSLDFQMAPSSGRGDLAFSGAPAAGADLIDDAALAQPESRFTGNSVRSLSDVENMEPARLGATLQRLGRSLQPTAGMPPAAVLQQVAQDMYRLQSRRLELMAGSRHVDDDGDVLPADAEEAASRQRAVQKADLGGLWGWEHTPSAPAAAADEPEAMVHLCFRAALLTTAMQQPHLVLPMLGHQRVRFFVARAGKVVPFYMDVAEAAPSLPDVAPSWLTLAEQAFLQAPGAPPPDVIDADSAARCLAMLTGRYAHGISVLGDTASTADLLRHIVTANPPRHRIVLATTLPHVDGWVAPRFVYGILGIYRRDGETRMALFNALTGNVFGIPLATFRMCFASVTILDA